MVSSIDTGSRWPSMSKSTKLSLIGVTILSARAWAARISRLSEPGVSITTNSASSRARPNTSSKRLTASLGSRRARAASSSDRRRSIGLGSSTPLAAHQALRLAKKRFIDCWRRSRSSAATLAPPCSRPVTRCMATVDLPAPPFSFPTTMTWASAMSASESRPQKPPGRGQGPTFRRPGSTRLRNLLTTQRPTRRRVRAVAPPVRAALRGRDRSSTGRPARPWAQDSASPGTAAGPGAPRARSSARR